MKQRIMFLVMVILLMGCEEKIDIPLITTAPISLITETSAVSGGEVIDDGGATITARGICWSNMPNPTIDDSKTINGSGLGSFISNLDGLNPETRYYVRAYASNSEGTAYGNEVNFKFGIEITTSGISAITETTATSGGNVINNGGPVITARGVCWSTSANPTISNNKTIDGSDIGSFISNITGLNPGTKYYLRAYATNSEGTEYGNQVIFLTSIVNVTDIDGNVYNAIKIGNQIWTKENLKTTRYNNGTVIDYVADSIEWGAISDGAWCYFNNEASYDTTYGKLYNWYSINTGILCPEGWHIPTDEDWTVLTEFLGGPNVAGGKMKDLSLLWELPNTGASNVSNFSGLPGGARDVNGQYRDEGLFAYWWSSTEYQTDEAWSFYINNLGTNASRNYNPKNLGISCRCIKD